MLIHKSIERTARYVCGGTQTTMACSSTLLPPCHRRTSGLWSSSSSSLSSLRRAFHTSEPRWAREEDFYKTLGIGRSATQKDIKMQFYKLSKKWHPDLNEGSEESKVRFQQVSEAYATLSDEQARRQYDRQTSASAFGSPRGQGSAGGAGRYDGRASENVQRRATASYAWEYHRRNTMRSQQQRRTSNAGDAHYHHDGASDSTRSSSSFAWGTGGAGASAGGGGGGGGGAGSMFERLERQQRRREEAMAARSSGQQAASQKARSEAASEDAASGHLIRFLQVSAMFGIIACISSFSRTDPAEAARKRLRTAAIQ